MDDVLDRILEAEVEENTDENCPSKMFKERALIHTPVLHMEKMIIKVKSTKCYNRENYQSLRV
jgi:hypothetical protein